jgi:rare lipoprotein A
MEEELSTQSLRTAISCVLAVSGVVALTGESSAGRERHVAGIANARWQYVHATRIPTPHNLDHGSVRLAGPGSPVPHNPVQHNPLHGSGCSIAHRAPGTPHNTVHTTELRVAHHGAPAPHEPAQGAPQRVAHRGPHRVAIEDAHRSRGDADREVHESDHSDHSFGGMASYYSEGQHLASGGTFNPSGLTAAHRSLPFGTHLRVSDPKSGRSVQVTVNDRGPFVHGRVLDLSLGAARALGMTGRGVMHVSAHVM